MALSAGEVQRGPWTKGVMYSVPKEDCPNDAIADMQNCRVGNSGQVVKRAGLASYQSEAAITGTPTVTGAYEFVKDSSNTYTVITAGDKVYYFTTTWVDITGTATVTAGNDNTFEFADDGNGTLVATNGVDPMWTWNGTGSASDLSVDSRFTVANHVIWWDNRMWVGGTSDNADRLWYSDIGIATTWRATSFFNQGSPITGLVGLDDKLCVHTQAGIYTLEATPEAATPYKREYLDLSSGVDQRSMVTLPGNRMLYLRKDGVYRWDGDSDEVEKVSFQLDTGYWDNLSTSRMAYAFALYYPKENEVWFFVRYDSSATACNHVIIYNEYADENDAVKHRWYGPYLNFTRDCAALIDNVPHAGGFDGILYEHETSATDASAAIEAEFTTSGAAPEDSSNLSRWLFARPFFDTDGDYDVTVTQESSGVVGTSNVVNMGGSAFSLGSSILDQDPLRTISMISEDIDLSGYDPQCGLKFVNNQASQSFTLRRVSMVFKDIGKKRRRKYGD